MHDPHERSYLPGQPQPPAPGPARRELLRRGHLVAGEAHGAAHELLREPGHEVQASQQPSGRKAEPGPGAGQLPRALLAPLQHQHPGCVPISWRAGHGDGHRFLGQPHLGAGHRIPSSGLRSPCHLRGLCAGLLAHLLRHPRQPALQRHRPAQQRLLFHDGHAVVHGLDSSAARVQAPFPDRWQCVASADSPPLGGKDWKRLLLHERAGPG
mmetsp:Transcript_15258/g.28755  ORF Transcript_15258/g.28755 Transcript_15258/m.28755 type:complete len:211 (-) Transcript_15258:369-1001(-)